MSCWYGFLFRAPFDDKKSFVAIREQIAELVQEIVECVQNPNKPEFFNVPQMLVDVCKNFSLLLTTTRLERHED